MLQKFYYTFAIEKFGIFKQPNHKGNWGDANTCRTVILADEFDLDGVYEAMSSRYIYSTEDNNLSVIYTMLDTDGKELALQGDVVEGHESDATVTLNVAISDADVEPIGKIEVIGESGKVLETVQDIASNTYTWTTEISNSSSYYYIRVTQPDGDIAVTAPIWVNAVAATRVTAKEELIRENTGMADVNVAEALTATVTNTGSENLTVNSYKIYVDGTAVDDKTLSNVTLADVAKHTLAYNWTPTEGGSHTVRTEFSVTQDETTILVSASTKIYVKGSDYAKVSTIAEAKNGALYQEFTVEGILTANTSGYDKDTAFFDCTYVQDETGGINIFPVSGNYRLGQKVRVHGAITYYAAKLN